MNDTLPCDSILATSSRRAFVKLTFAVWGTTNGGPAAHSKEDITAILTGGSRLGIKHAGHVPCENQVPLGNLMRTVTEKMGVEVDDRFCGGAHSGVIKEIV